MIDWGGLLAHALWVLGLAGLLAVGSETLWRSRTLRHSLEERPAARLAMAASLALCALGGLFRVDHWLSGTAWAGVLVLVVWEAISAWRARPNPTHETDALVASTDALTRDTNS